MKRILPLFLIVAFLAALVWTLLFLYNKSQTVPEVFETATPVTKTIIKKTVATGAIEPRQQIDIKPRVSGVIEELLVEAGEMVEAGQKLATIKIIPNMITLNQAESSLESARISFRNAKSEFARNEALYKSGVISQTELSQFNLNFKLRKQEVSAAQANVQLIKSGASKGGKKVSNIITSTVAGMVIEVPIKVGASVTEANTFNEGTTIATIADMNDMVFIGKVDESEVGKVSIGMPLSVEIGAIDDQKFSGSLEYIAPKGSSVDGAIQFEVRAAMEKTNAAFIRAGYSANADIVLKEAKDVLAISEALLQFEGETTYVEIKNEDGSFTRAEVSLGLSDGIFVEVLGGLDKDQALKKPRAVRGGKTR